MTPISSAIAAAGAVSPASPMSSAATTVMQRAEAAAQIFQNSGHALAVSAVFNTSVLLSQEPQSRNMASWVVFEAVSGPGVNK